MPVRRIPVVRIAIVLLVFEPIVWITHAAQIPFPSVVCVQQVHFIVRLPYTLTILATIVFVVYLRIAAEAATQCHINNEIIISL